MGTNANVIKDQKYNNDEFKNCLEAALNSATLSEVERDGYCHLEEEYMNESGQKVEAAVYELNSKIYIIKYVDKECVQFKEINLVR